MSTVFVAAIDGADSLRALNFSRAAAKLRASIRPTVPLSDVLWITGRSYGKVFVRYDCEPSHGEELLTQGDIFATEPAGRWIRSDVLPNISDHRLDKWQVLIAGAGQMGETDLFGRSIIVDDRLAGRITGPHALRLSAVGELDLALFAYAVLNTRPGLAMVRSTAFGSSIPSIREDLLRSLPMPLPDTATQKRVAGLVRTTVAERERYLLEIKAARACIEALPEMQEATVLCRDRKARCVVWRGELPTMTAWTFGSAGEALALLQRSWRGRLGDIVPNENIFNGPRFARIGCSSPHGVPFLSQRDLFLIRPIPRQIVDPGFGRRLLFTDARSLLVGGHGTLGEGEIFGRCVFVSDDLAHFALTQDMLRIWPQPEHAEVLYAFLSSPVGLRLIRSTAVGTKIMSLRTDLLRALPIPDLPPDMHARVTSHVQNAMDARAAATRAEREAIRIVEEEVLPTWLA